MLKSILIFCLAFNTVSSFGAGQASVRVEPANLHGSRPLQEQTETAVIRDYMQSWESFRAALEQNSALLLDQDFVGTAKEKLTDTIQQQALLGVSTHYMDREHDLQIVFYSPEGLCIEIVDKVQYDMQFLDKKRVITTQRMSARYIVILTPSEVRWRVRVFQTVPE